MFCEGKLKVHRSAFFPLIYIVCMFLLHRDYTNLFEPIVIEDDDEIENCTEVKKHDLPPEEYVLVNFIFCLKFTITLALHIIT